MIELTRLNKHLFLLNPELIKVVEANPDTMITLLNGEKIFVLEPPQIVADRVFVYRVELARAVSTGRIAKLSGSESNPNSEPSRSPGSNG
jgi:flagellar protein FlbD